MYTVHFRMVDHEEFLQDCEKSRKLVDELCAAAVSLPTGGYMGYSNFIDARNEFKQHIEKLINSYKTIEIN